MGYIQKVEMQCGGLTEELWRERNIKFQMQKYSRVPPGKNNGPVSVCIPLLWITLSRDH